MIFKISYKAIILAFGITFFFSCGKESVSTDSPRGCTLLDQEIELVQEFSAIAYPFVDSDPNSIDNMLDPLIEYISKAHIVGLGEGTHGTKEFYDMKHKIFRSLVIDKGFKAIIFEIPWGNALVVNDFVVNGNGTAEEAIDQTWYWTYNTEEVRHLAQWMHDYNLDRADHEKIYFVGCDPQGPNFEIEENLVRNYILSIFPDSAFYLSSAYQNLPNGDLSNYHLTDSDIQLSNRKGVSQVLRLFEEQQEILIENSSVKEFEIAKMAAHLISQRERIYRTQQNGAPRDSLMAHYTMWWQQIFGSESKVAVWAHNLHVMDGGSFNSAFMGTVLKDALDDDYRNVGFSFGQGSLNAFLADRNRDPIGGARRQVLGEPVCRTTNFLLSEVEGGQHYYIFDEASGRAADYFQAPNPFMQCGAGFNPNFVQNYVQNIPLSNTLDVLIHFDETRASDLR